MSVARDSIARFLDKPSSITAPMSDERDWESYDDEDEEESPSKPVSTNMDRWGRQVEGEKKRAVKFLWLEKITTAARDMTFAQFQIAMVLFAKATKSDTPQAWPSYPFIMDVTGIGSTATVRKAIKQLEQLGWIETLGDPGNGNIYTLTFPQGEQA